MDAKKILSFLKGKRQSVVGIDIGSSSIKVVQIHKEKGIAALDTYGSLSVSPYIEGVETGQWANANEEVLHTVLSSLLQEAKVTTTTAGVSIPFHSTLISLIEVPLLSDEKIAQTIPFEAKRYIPVPLEDVSLDWFIIPEVLLNQESRPIFENKDGNKDEERKRKVLLVAIHNHEIIKHKNILSKTKLETRFFEIEIFSTLRSSVYESGLPVIVIDIGARSSKFYIVEHGIVLRSFFINQGGQNISQAVSHAEGVSFKEAEQKKREFGFRINNRETRHAMSLVTDEIFTEANNAIIEFEQRYHQSVSKMILTGGGAAMKGLFDEAEKKTSISVEIANPFARLRHPALLSESLKENGSEFSVAIGAALRALEE